MQPARQHRAAWIRLGCGGDLRGLLTDMSIVLLARDLGLSISTVSRALNGYHDVAPATKQRVLKRAREIGYRPNPGARRLKSGRSSLVGVILPAASDGVRFVDSVASSLLGGVEVELENGGYGLIATMQTRNDLVRLREKGYARALAKHRIAPDRLLMLNGDLSEVSGYALCRSLLVSAVPPTAIVCATDAMAIGAIAACRERGMAVGHEISIAGYGNSSASGFCDPPLTTIDHAVFENGRHIGQSLLRLLRAEGKPADIHYLEPVVLVPRKSDCPRK